MPKSPNIEQIIYEVVKNVNEKISAASVLYSKKINFNSAFFLLIIAQEEMAKLFLIPIANEIGELNNLLFDRGGPFYSHKVKQRIYSSYNFLERKLDEIDAKKQQSLYVGKINNRIGTLQISHKKCFEEIKNTIALQQYQLKNISQSNKFEKKFIDTLLKLTEDLGKIVNSNVPRLAKVYFDDVKKEVNRMRKNNKTFEKNITNLFLKTHII